MPPRILLTLDAVVNLALGLLLVLFPAPVVSALGVPNAVPAFYPSILGAVLFGIGIALILEVRNTSTTARGLALFGAVAINLSGGLVLGAWLLWGDLGLPLRGQRFLWGLVALLVGLSAVELLAD